MTFATYVCGLTFYGAAPTADCRDCRGTVLVESAEQAPFGLDENAFLVSWLRGAGYVGGGGVVDRGVGVVQGKRVVQ